MIKLLYQKKVLFYCLLIYLVAQFSFWYVEGLLQPILLIVQEMAYIGAIIYSTLLILKKTHSYERGLLINLIAAFFITNLLLLLHWVVVVYFNPEINWKLQGNNYEVDPWYYILYVPIVNFLIALLVLSIAYVIEKSWVKKRTVQDTTKPH